MNHWQELLEMLLKNVGGRITLIQNITVWTTRKHDQIDFYITQLY